MKNNPYVAYGSHVTYLLTTQYNGCQLSHASVFFMQPTNKKNEKYLIEKNVTIRQLYFKTNELFVIFIKNKIKSQKKGRKNISSPEIQMAVTNKKIKIDFYRLLCGLKKYALLQNFTGLRPKITILLTKIKNRNCNFNIFINKKTG